MLAFSGCVRSIINRIRAKLLEAALIVSAASATGRRATYATRSRANSSGLRRFLRYRSFRLGSGQLTNKTPPITAAKLSKNTGVARSDSNSTPSVAATIGFRLM